MTPERKAARRMQIANTIMNGVGSAATVAATIAGGPIAGLLVHKTAKNLKKAAPGVVNASIAKVGELKTKAKAKKEEIEARRKLKEDKAELRDASKDYKQATNNREKLEKEYLKNGGKLESLDKDDSEAGKALKKAMQSESNAKGRFEKAQQAVTDDKAAVERSMTPERKAARRMQIANTIMNGVGSAATVAATIAGGPIAGLLVHKTAKNLKKAAPGVVNASIAKFGELKSKAKDGLKSFKEADNLSKAEMIANFAAISKSREGHETLTLLRGIVGDEVVDMIQNFYYDNIVNKEYSVENKKGL
jgi:chromosome segregation ATPase